MLAALAKPRRIKESHRRRRRGASRVWLPGQYFDAESGLTYNVNRDYEAATGRYIQSDPIGLMGGWNTYVYASSKPMGFVDPSGLQVNLNLFPHGSDQWQSANNYPQSPGTYSVGAHGNPNLIVDADGNPIMPQSLADMIKKDKNYHPGDQIVLLACNTGKTPQKPYLPVPYAQFLANDMAYGTVVSAPNNFIWLSDQPGSPPIVAGALDSAGQPVDWTKTSVVPGGITMNPNDPGAMIPFPHQGK